MRWTVDGYQLKNDQYAWEIQYRWLNFEISLANAVKTRVGEMPENTRIWKAPSKLRLLCNKINRALYDPHIQPK